MKNILILLSLTILLTGCAAMSVEQCKTANWLSVGEQDGSAGHETRLDQYYSSCQKANIVPNQRLYEKGYQQGLGYYCQPENIFDEALEGRGNFRVCPLEKRQALRPYYQVANAYYLADSEFSRSQNEINRYLKQLERTDLSSKVRDHYKQHLYNLRIHSSSVQLRYHNAVHNMERFKAEHGFN